MFKGLGGLGDMAGMMKKAQEMQGKMAQLQDEMHNIMVTGESGAGLVRATATAKGELTALEIDPSIFNPDEKEVVEDLILAAIKQVEVDTREELDDTAVLAVITKMVKQRRDSADQYQKAGREELAAQENYEIGVIQEFLPTQLSEAELVAMVDEAIAASGATGMQGMGAVMGQLKPKLQGRADVGAVSHLVKARLTS